MARGHRQFHPGRHRPVRQQASRSQKDNIRRFLGFGIVDPEEAIACADDRATFWATGSLGPNRCLHVDIPIPSVISGQPRPHALSATLAWFTPLAVGRKNYRTVRLKQLDGLEDLRVRAHRSQPDIYQDKSWDIDHTSLDR